MAIWPVQSNCPSYYGQVNQISAQLVMVKTPWALYFEGKPVGGISIHKKCAPSLQRVLDAIWVRLGKSQAEIDRIGLSKFSGSYNPRKIAGSNNWSMHAYGCAVDFDSANNWLGDTTPAMDRRVVEEFEREGWEWGGHWKRPDGMHFQAAWTRVNPPRLGTLTVQTPTQKKALVQVSQKANILDKVMKAARAMAASAAGIFTADNLGLFTGWMSPFSGMGKFALLAGILFIGYWLLSDTLLKLMAKDHDEGRYTPSGAVPQPELAEVPNAVVEQPS